MKGTSDEHIEVLAVSSQWVAYRRVTCAQDQIGATITAPDVYPGIYDLAVQNEVKAGPPYARYIEWREHDCDILCGVPLSGPVQPEGNIMVDQYTACTMVTYAFHGRYDQLGEAHDVVIEYIQRKGLKHGGPCWEIYDGPPGENGVALTHVCYAIEP